ncbi:hypothetical protein SASPL_108419 [Salvia splendens]|uniref:Uncharacterized protein n=1 Tax=Salvia splendens TaxID=180675 RepID=A0A8X8YEQ2_SALSN|nr:hypothetical protein SASPL_108419 [Salvia splendens]
MHFEFNNSLALFTSLYSLTVNAITLVLEPFTLENGLLTPTFKVKRPQAKEYFAHAIARMYAELSTSDPTGAPQKMFRQSQFHTTLGLQNSYILMPNYTNIQ